MFMTFFYKITSSRPEHYNLWNELAYMSRPFGSTEMRAFLAYFRTLF